MEELDLNIDNYDYKDILNLFKIPINFGENHLKQAKKKVLLMHPDKSILDKKYFIFFSQAYKTIYSIYQFREKIDKGNDLPKEDIEYLAEEDIYNRETIESLKKNNKLNQDNFNKWFNELFEKVNVKSDYDNNGYGNWLKQDSEIIENCKTMKDMEEKMNLRKQKVREHALQKYNGINEFNSTSYCDLTNSIPEEYSSDMFSTLKYDDLKRAHEESVIPVTQDDYNRSYNTIEEARLDRQNVLNPLSEKDAIDKLNKMKLEDNELSSMRAFELIKQDRQNEIINKRWWSSLKQLK